MSFTLWALPMTYIGYTNYIQNVTHAMWARSVSKTPVPFFAICEPKFTKLSAYSQERLQFCMPFSVRPHHVSFRSYSGAYKPFLCRKGRVARSWSRGVYPSQRRGRRLPPPCLVWRVVHPPPKSLLPAVLVWHRIYIFCCNNACLLVFSLEFSRKYCLVLTFAQYQTL